MMKYCFPQLRTENARLWADRFALLKPSEIAAQRAPDDIDGVFYTPIGGQKVPEEILDSLRVDIIALAKEAGFPERRHPDGQRVFEEATARRLAELPIIPAEAYRSEVWQYLACRLMPEIIAWRFGELNDDALPKKINKKHFLGGVRNGFQRLWLRTLILRDPSADDELWLLDVTRGALTEDNFVQLIERPGISSFRRLSRNLAQEFVRYRDEVVYEAPLTSEKLLREVTKRVLRTLAFANIDAIDEAEQLQILRGIFQRVIETAKQEKSAEDEGVSQSQRIAAAPEPARATVKPARVFNGFVVRVLRPIDLPNCGNNQHEIQGVSSLRSLLGETPREFHCKWHSYQGNGAIREELETRVKWYDARATHPTRSEWRLYYPKGTPLENARPGDALLIATRVGEPFALYTYLIPQKAVIFFAVQEALAQESDVVVSDKTEKFIRTRFIAQV